MSCALWISGKNLDVDKLTKKLSIKPCAIYKKGEPLFKLKPNGRKYYDSGMSFSPSKASFDRLDKQIKDTIRFLQKHNKSLKKLTTNKDTDSSVIDFGIYLRMGYNNIIAQSDYFPSELLKLAGDLKIDLGLSLYPPLQDEQMKKRFTKFNQNKK
jgi:hypothetical protein